MRNLSISDYIAIALGVSMILMFIAGYNAMQPKPAHRVLMYREDALEISTRQITPVYDPAGPDRDCSDFATRHQANVFYRAAGGPADDHHALDDDGDGVPCESIPTPTFMPFDSLSPHEQRRLDPTPQASR